jgi:hypothetical protein
MTATCNTCNKPVDPESTGSSDLVCCCEVQDEGWLDYINLELMVTIIAIICGCLALAFGDLL